MWWDYNFPPCPFFFQIGETNDDFDIKIIVNDTSNQHVAYFRFLCTMIKA
jgi:hypothetical protein